MRAREIGAMLRCPTTGAAPLRWEDGAWRGAGGALLPGSSSSVDATLGEPAFLAPIPSVRHSPLLGRAFGAVEERLARAVSGRDTRTEAALVAALLNVRAQSRIIRIGEWSSGVTPELARRLDPNRGLLAAVSRIAPPAGASNVVLAVRAHSWRLPFSDGAFDGATTSTLHVETDPRAVLAELTRVVRPGGRVVLSTVFSQGGRRRRQLWRAAPAPVGLRVFELDRLVAMLLDVGLALRDEVLEGRSVVLSAERCS